VITSELGRLQVLAGVIEHHAQYLPPVKLTESELAEFDKLWEATINFNELNKLTEDEQSKVKEVLSMIKDFTLKLWAGVSNAGEVVFKNLNKMVVFVVTKLLFKPLSWILAGIGLVYSTLIKVLDVEIFGREFTLGSDLNDAVLSSIEQGYDKFISFIESYEPTSIAGTPIEILTETVAAGLKAIGVAMPIMIKSLAWIGDWLLTLGLGTTAIIISWLYLIGGTSFLFKKAQGVLAPVLKNKLVKDVEAEANKAKQSGAELNHGPDPSKKLDF
tara:strand:+ start:92 stop:910 length:819 start_codon:yes stop_codon:yes gene_type:complete